MDYANRRIGESSQKIRVRVVTGITVCSVGTIAAPPHSGHSSRISLECKPRFFGCCPSRDAVLLIMSLGNTDASFPGQVAGSLSVMFNHRRGHRISRMANQKRRHTFENPNGDDDPDVAKVYLDRLAAYGDMAQLSTTLA